MIKASSMITRILSQSAGTLKLVYLVRSRGGLREKSIPPHLVDDELHSEIR
jgi:hypothetical protein